MKILRLELLAFGPFTEAGLDLAHGEHGLHIVYGPNEAGKSSALRALRQMLFGIETRTTDNFLHDHRDMRVGATLRSPSGTVLECVRRKGTKNTLLGGDRESLVDPSLLNEFLGGIEEPIFRQRFGIDYDELVRGGRALAEGTDLGQILFAAAAGVAGLAKVQTQFISDATALFKPSGSAPPLNVALKNYTDTRKAVREAQLPSAEWLKHDGALTEALAQREQVERRLSEVLAEERRLSRTQDALPLQAARKRLLHELNSLADLPELHEGFAEERRRVMGELAVAEATEKNVAETLAGIARSVESLEAPCGLLDHAATIKQLQTGLGEYRKALQDRPALNAAQEQLEQEAAELLRELGRDIAIGEIASLRTPRPQRLHIAELGLKQKALDEGVRLARTALQKVEADIERQEGELSTISTPPDADELRHALARCQRQGGIEKTLAEDQAELASRAYQAELDLRKLAPWSGTLAELESLLAPAAETIERFDRELDRHAVVVRDLERDIIAATEESHDIEHEIEQLRLQQDVPTEDDLAHARESREAGWQLVRAAWERGEQVSDRVAQFVANSPPAADLGQAYEQRLAEADLVADRLRREAQQVAGKARLIAERRRVAERLADRQQQLLAANAALEGVKREWQEAWEAARLKPLSPKEMNAWRIRQLNLVGAAREIREQQSAVVALANEIQALREDLSNSLKNLAITVPASVKTLAELLLFSEKELQRLADTAQQRQQLERDLSRLQSQLPAARSTLAAAEQEFADWKTEWTAAIACLGLTGDAYPAEASAVISTTEDLFAKQREADDKRKRVAGIDRDTARFSAEVAEVVAMLAPDLKEAGVEQAISSLAERLTAAQKSRARLDELEQQAARETQKQTQAKQKCVELRALLATLCREAKCASVEDLPAVEQQVSRRHSAREELAGIEQELLKLASGLSLEEFLAEVDAAKPDELPPRLARLTAEQRELEENRAKLSEQIGGERQTLSGMNGVGKAAEADEMAQSHLAQVQSLAARYVGLKLASVVLAKAIERYRERHQGPVLARASELFAELTLGSFSGLRADCHENGQAVLVGLRPGGKQSVGLEGMSDGTCDQMYLALRIASLEEFLRNNPPLPFIVDDILIKFDDDRAVAALKALARLSQQTQVIFFTHHEHLVTLARENLDDDVLFVQELARAGVERSMA